jgi:hypothetical protein
MARVRCCPAARCLWTLLTALVPILAADGARAQSQSLPPACPPSTPLALPWNDREGSLERHGDLPLACLRALVRQCDREANQRFLDASLAYLCSVRYEALLHHGFGGDFQALVAWWRQREAGDD